MASGGLPGQVAELRRIVGEQQKALDEALKEIALLRSDVSGERGLTEAVKEVVRQLAGVRKQLWGVMVIIVGACVTTILTLTAGPG